MQKITLIATLILLLAGGAFAQLIIETVSVGNPGNPDDVHFSGFGGVDYTYNIGKYMVTAGQYTDFLNAVAGDDTYELYHYDARDLRRSGIKRMWNFSQRFPRQLYL